MTKIEIECEVCGEVFPYPNRVDARILTTWMINKEGREEGVTHCQGCRPLSLSHIVRHAPYGLHQVLFRR